MGFSLAAPIGPVNIETIKRGFQSGLKPAVMFGAGAIFGDMFYCVLLLVGIVPLIAAVPGLQRFLFAAGAVIMVYLGWGGVKEFWQQKEIDMQPRHQDRPSINDFSMGWAMAVFNPYALLWYLTAGGAYISTGVAQSGILGGLASISFFLVGVSLWLTLLVFVIHRARPLITSKTMRVISGLSGIALWGFAVYFIINLTMG